MNTNEIIITNIFKCIHTNNIIFYKYKFSEKKNELYTIINKKLIVK